MKKKFIAVIHSFFMDSKGFMTKELDATDIKAACMQANAMAKQMEHDFSHTAATVVEFDRLEIKIDTLEQAKKDKDELARIIHKSIEQYESKYPQTRIGGVDIHRISTMGGMRGTITGVHISTEII